MEIFFPGTGVLLSMYACQHCHRYEGWLASCLTCKGEVMQAALTLQSQLPAMRKFCGSEGGENSSAETVSSGGETTSRSLLGLGTAPTVLKPPNILALRRFYQIKLQLKKVNGIAHNIKQRIFKDKKEKDKTLTYYYTVFGTLLFNANEGLYRRLSKKIMQIRSF